MTSTLLLADCPDRLAPVLGPGIRWRRLGRAAPPAVAAEVLRVLGAPAALWRASAGWPVPLDPLWRLLILIGDAPRSQFDALQELSPASLEGGVACVALAGSGFHGQRGRAWSALSGNLHLSASLPLGAPVPAVLPALTALPAVAAIDAIPRATGGALRPRIKWVNDVLLDGRKVAGVLTATRCKGPLVQRAVVGVGVNVARTPELAPTPFVPAATSLQEAVGAPVDLGVLLRALLDALAAHLHVLRAQGGAPLVARYRQASMVVGQRVALYPEDSDGADATPLAQGVVAAINPDLSLSLEDQVEPVCRGRLALIDTARSSGTPGDPPR